MADARYVIDLILEAKDQTSTAVNKALANLGLLDAKTKQSALEAEKFGERYERAMGGVDKSSATLKKTREDLKEVGDEFGLTAKKSLEAAEKLDAATRKHQRALVQYGEENRKAKLALFDVLEAQEALGKEEDYAIARKVRLTAATEENTKIEQENTATVVDGLQKRAKARKDLDAILDQSDKEAAERRKKVADDLVADLAADEKRRESKRKTFDEEVKQRQEAARLDRKFEDDRKADRDAATARARSIGGSLSEPGLDPDTIRNYRKELVEVRKELEATGLSRQRSNDIIVRSLREQGALDSETHAAALQNQRDLDVKSRLLIQTGEAQKLLNDQQREHQRLSTDVGKARSDAEAGRRLGATPDIQRTLDLRVEKFEAKLALIEEQIRAVDGKTIDVDAELHATKFLAEAAAVKSSISSLSDESNAFKRVQNAVGDSFQNSSQRISSFDNYLRGLLTLGATVFIEQLVQVGGAAVGMFGALAASAVQAGAALGGAFAAGAAQAIPVIGVIATIGSRLGTVFKAVQQANLLQQQQSYQGAKASNTQANALDTLTSANEGVANAQRGVAKAQEALTRARRDAVRQLQDLILAERAAELAAEGAALSQDDAQRALQKAVATGGDVTRAQLDVQNADLNVDQSTRNVSEARRKLDEGRDPEQTDAVKNAKEGVADAERSLDSAARGVERAKRASQIADANITAAAGTLAFLRKQLSASERELLDAMLLLQDQFHIFAKNISAPVIEEMTKIVKFTTGALKDPKIIAAAAGISQAIADSMDRVFKAFTTSGALDQIERIAGLAAENFGPLTDAFIAFGEGFLNLAEILSPILSTLLSYVADIATQFLVLTEDQDFKKGAAAYFAQGVGAIKEWADLLVNIVKLFLAISGAGGAETGTKAVSDLSDAIGRAADEINTKGSKAETWFRRFFATSRGIIDALLPIFQSLAREFRKTFDDDAVSSIQGFTKIVADVIIPALGGFIRKVGGLLELLSNIFAIPGAAKLAAFALSFLLFFTAVSKVRALFSPLVALVRALGTEFLRMGGYGGKNVSILTAMGTAAGKLATALGGVVGKIPGLSRIAGLLTGGGVALGAAAKARDGLDLGPKIRGVQRVFVVNWPPALLAGGGGLGGGRGGGGPVPVGGAGGAAATVAEREAAAVAAAAAGARGTPVAALRTSAGRIGPALARARGALAGSVALIPGVAEASVTRAALAARYAPLLARTGRVASVAARAGGGLGTLGLTLGAGYLGDKIGGKSGGALSGAATGAGVGALAGSVIPGFGTAVGAGLGAAVGGTLGVLKASSAEASKAAGNSVREFATTAEKNLAHFKTAASASGIQTLIDHAKELAKDSPEAADALNKFADKATKVRDEVTKVLIPLGRMRGEFEKKKLSADDVLDPNAAAQFLSNMERIRKNGVSSITELRKNMRFNLDEIGKGFTEGTPAWQSAIIQNFGGGIKAIQDGMEDGKISVKDGTKEIARITKEQMGFARDNMSSLSADAKHALARNFRAAATAAGYSADNIENLTQSALKKIRKYLAASFALYGLSEGEAAALAKNRTTKGRENLNQFNAPEEGSAFRAVGGWVGNPGERGRDGVRTVLGRGEAVLNWGQQKAVNAAMRGQETLQSIFGRTRGYHAGGHGAPGLAEGGGDLFDGHPSNVNANLKKLIELMKSKFSLIVTSTTDHSTLTTSGNRSDHVDGNAVDLSSNTGVMNRAAEYVLSSGLAKRLKQAIYNGSPQLTWSGGKDVGPGYFGPTVMGQHSNHLHLALIGAVGKLSAAASATTSAVKKIKAPKIPGGGELGVFAQRGVDLVTAAANRVLARAAKRAGVEGSDSDGDTPNIGQGAAGKEIFSFFRRAGFTDNQAAAFVGNFVQESGLNPAAVQPNGEGHGLGQWGGGRFAALQAFAKERDKPWQDLQTQLDFVLHELRGSESAAYSSIKAAKSLEDAVNAIGIKYERYGIAGDRSGPARKALAAYGGEFAEGGIVPGGEGRPVKILAHAGEWVLNRVQQSKLAQAVGTGVGNLRSALGFSGGPTSFAGGGSVEFYSGATAAEDERHEITLARLKGKNHADERRDEEIRHKARLKNIKEDEAAERKRFKTLTDEQQRVSNVGRGQYGSPENLPTSVSGNARELARFRRAQRNLGTPRGTGDRLDQFSANLDNLTNEDNGVLTQLNAAIGVQAAQAATRIQLLQNGFKRIVAKGISKLVPIKAIVDGVEIAKRELEALEDTGRGLERERAATANSLARANRALASLRRRGVAPDDKAYQKLLGQRNLLQTTLDSQDDALAQNYADRLAKRQEKFQAQTDKLLADSTARSNRIGLQQQVGDALGYGKQTVGTETFDATTPLSLAQGDESAARDAQKILKGRLDKLTLAAAKDPNRQAELDTVKGLYDDATSRLATAMATTVETGLSDITNVFDQNQAGRDFAEKIAGLLGNNAKIGELTTSAIGDNINELDKLQAYLATIDPANTVGAQKVKDKIQEVSGTLYDNFFKLVSNAEAEFSETTSGLDLRGRALDLKERLGGAQAKLDNFGGRAGIETDRLAAIELERSRVRAAIADANAHGFTDVAARLGKTLAKLDQDFDDTSATLRELTAQQRAAAVDLITGKATRATGIIGQGIDLLTKIGVNAGTPYDASGLLKQQGDVLRAAAPDIANQALAGAGEFAAGGNKGASGVLESLRSAFLAGPTEFANQYAKLAPDISELETKMGPEELATFQKLIDAMFQNTSSVIDNTKAVDDATGASQGPQSFASSSWSWFRNALFSGMGQVLPSYDVPHMASGGSIRKGGIFELHPGEFVVNPEGSNVPDSGDINITMNSVNGDVDLTALSARIAFAKKSRV